MVKIKNSNDKLKGFYDFIWSMATANKTNKFLEYALAQKFFSVLIGSCDVYETTKGGDLFIAYFNKVDLTAITYDQWTNVF